MRRFILVSVVFLLSTCSALAKDMTFALQEKDFRPDFDLYQWIFADGEIVPGTTDQFLAFTKANPQVIKSATVILNSPGGSPTEGMRLGDAIRGLHFRTDVGTAGSARFTTRTSTPPSWSNWIAFFHLSRLAETNSLVLNTLTKIDLTSPTWNLTGVGRQVWAADVSIG